MCTHTHMFLLLHDTIMWICIHPTTKCQYFKTIFLYFHIMHYYILFCLFVAISLSIQVLGISKIFPKKYSNWFPEVECITWMSGYDDRIAVGCGDMNTTWIYRLSESTLKWSLEVTLRSERYGYGSIVHMGKNILGIAEMTNQIQIHEYADGAWTPVDQCLFQSLEPQYDDEAFGASMAFTKDGFLVSDPHAVRVIDGKACECVGVAYYVPYQTGCTFGDPVVFESKIQTEDGYFGFPIRVTKDPFDEDNRQLLIGAPGEDSGFNCNAGRAYYYANYSEALAPIDLSLFTLGVDRDEIACDRGMEFGLGIDFERDMMLLGGMYGYWNDKIGYAFDCTIASYGNYTCKRVPTTDDMTSSFTPVTLIGHDFIDLDTKEPLETRIFSDPDNCVIYVFFDGYKSPPQIYDLANDLSEVDWVIQGKFHLIMANESKIVVLENDYPHTFKPTQAPTRPVEPSPPFANWKILAIVAGVLTLVWVCAIRWGYTYLRRHRPVKLTKSFLSHI